MDILGPLETGEVKAVRFEFSSEVAGGLSLNSAAVTCSLLQGVDPTPGAVLSGPPSISGTAVVQLIHLGVAGCTYKISAYVSDSSGLRHHIPAKIQVVPA